jgi:hypothetical protein
MRLVPQIESHQTHGYDRYVNFVYSFLILITFDYYGQKFKQALFILNNLLHLQLFFHLNEFSFRHLARRLAHES